MALFVAGIRADVVSGGNSAKLAAVCRNNQAKRPQDCDVDCISDYLHCAMHFPDCELGRGGPLAAALHIIDMGFACPSKAMQCRAMQYNAIGASAGVVLAQ